MTERQLRDDSADPAGVPEEGPRPCVACVGADWREFFRLGSLHDRVEWMDRHVPGPARSQEELVALPPPRRSDVTPG